MPGFLYHSPQRIIGAYLVEVGIGSDEDENGIASNPWPIYDGREPDRPDDVIRISGTAGRGFGYTQVDSERQEMNGIQVMVRSVTDADAWLKIQEIAITLDRLRNVHVRLPLPVDSIALTGTGTGTGGGEVVYNIASVARTSEPIFLGRDTPQGKRILYTVNALASIRICAL